MGGAGLVCSSPRWWWWPLCRRAWLFCPSPLSYWWLGLGGARTSLHWAPNRWTYKSKGTQLIFWFYFIDIFKQNHLIGTFLKPQCDKVLVMVSPTSAISEPVTVSLVMSANVCCPLGCFCTRSKGTDAWPSNESDKEETVMWSSSLIHTTSAITLTFRLPSEVCPSFINWMLSSFDRPFNSLRRNWNKQNKYGQQKDRGQIGLHTSCWCVRLTR